MKQKIFLALIFCFFMRDASSLEEVVMHEFVYEPSFKVSMAVNIGKDIGNVEFNLTRDNIKGVLTGVSVSYPGHARLHISKKILTCISDPTIEAASFYFTNIGPRETIPVGWVSAIRIPFSSKLNNTMENFIIIPLYPAIIFEFVDFRLNRIKVEMSPTDVRSKIIVEEKCPNDLIDGSLENSTLPET